MKIGILTLAQETNYGGILQAYALQKILRDMGHEVYTIDRHSHRKYLSFKTNFLSFLKRLKLRFLNHKQVSISWNPFMSEEIYRKISVNTRNFVEKNMSMTHECRFDELRIIDKEYLFDAYIVGSDQVWLPTYYPSSFLDYVERKGVLKIVYAASCGQKSFLDIKGVKENVRKFADQFVGISVREDTLVSRTEDALGRKPIHVLDPTMLLSPNDYLKVTENKVGNLPIVFAYILDNNQQKNSILEEVSLLKGLKVKTISPPQKYIKGVTTNIDECVFPSIDDWIHNLSRSEFVVTDSFHGTVFAILFNKQFITIGNKMRGLDRFQSLLRMFHLEDRLISETDIDFKRLIRNKIDYSIVNHILSIKRTESIQFLIKCLNDAKKYK